MKRKHVIMIQGLVSLVLTVLMGIMALLPIFNVTVRPNDDLYSAMTLVISTASRIEASEAKEEKAVEEILERYVAYSEALQESRELERDLTDDELERNSEYAQTGALIAGKLIDLNTMKLIYDHMDSGTEKTALAAEIEAKDAEIQEDLQNLKYYSVPVQTKGYQVKVSFLQIAANASKWSKVAILAYKTMDYQYQLSDSNINENSISTMLELAQWFKSHEDYYKNTVSETSIGITLFLLNCIEYGNAVDSTSEANSLYNIAFTDERLGLETMSYAIFAILADLFMVAFSVSAIFIAFFTALGALLALGNKQKLYARSIGGFRRMSYTSGLLFASLSLMNYAVLGIGGILYVVFLALGTVANGLAARTKLTDNTEELYLDITQGWGILTFIGLLVGAVSLGASGFLPAFYHRGSIFEKAKKVGASAVGNNATFSLIFALFFIIAFYCIYIALLKISLSDKIKISAKTEQIKNKSTAYLSKLMLGCSIATILIIFVFVFVFSLNLIGVSGVLAGMILVLASAVAYMVLTNKFCRNLNATEKANLNAMSLPEENEDLEEKIYIPVIGIFIEKSQKPANVSTNKTVEQPAQNLNNTKQ